jgi:hypothetical protein
MLGWSRRFSIGKLLLYHGFESYVSSLVEGGVVSYASTLNAGRGLVTASLPCLASTCEKGVLQDDIPTAHVIAYLPAWYLIFFSPAPCGSHPSQPLLCLYVVALVAQACSSSCELASLRLDIPWSNTYIPDKRHLSAFFPLKASWNHGLLTLGPCTHYTA